MAFLGKDAMPARPAHVVTVDVVALGPRVPSVRILMEPPADGVVRRAPDLDRGPEGQWEEHPGGE